MQCVLSHAPCTLHLAGHSSAVCTQVEGLRTLQPRRRAIAGPGMVEGGCGGFVWFCDCPMGAFDAPGRFSCAHCLSLLRLHWSYPGLLGYSGSYEGSGFSRQY